jgi:5'-nucleotidase
MPPLDLSKCFVVGISSRALFDLKKEDEIFCTQGAKAYTEYQIAHEEEVLKPGTGFPLAQAILRLNGETPRKEACRHRRDV